MIYWVLYTMMVVGFFGLSMINPSLKMKVLGVLLTIVNGMLFWR